ncbi:hypothetical protein HVX06_16930 [Enterobacter sp. RHB15-C17]|nr:hypothetical protein HVX06_16930 [Enterobacter sp. RHB15-C17]
MWIEFNYFFSDMAG